MGTRPNLKPGDGLYPVKIDGETRLVRSVTRSDGSVRILPPKRAKVVTEPTVNTTVSSPRILNSVARMSRRLVLRAAKAGDPEQYAFGRYPVEPQVIAADDTGDSLVLDLMWSVGEVQRVCNGIVPSIDPPGTWDHSIYMPDIGIQIISGANYEHFTGTAGQSASTIMTALKGSYDALPGIAHSVITMQPGWNLNILGTCDGVKVIDPRTSPHTTAWTENPALILADIFTRCGYTMNWTSVGEAADYCDEIADETFSPGQTRWVIGGVIYDRQSLHSWVYALAQYANCYVDIRGASSGSEVILVPDKPRSSNHTVTAASIVEGSERLSYRGSRDAPDLVTVNYKPSTAVFSASYGTSGGAGTETTLNMPWWDKAGHAGRKAEETHRKANNPIESLEFIGWDDGLIRTLGDVGTITLPSVGLSSQLMALVENEPVQRGRWRRKYIEYDATNYVNSFAGTDLGGAEGTLYNPYYPPPGPTPTLTAELVTSTSPNYYRIKIDFAPTTWAYLQDYKINVYQDGVSPQPILHSEYVTKGSETGSPLTITVYADLTDSPGFQMSIGNSPQTVYRVDVYNRSLWTDQEGNEVLSATPGTATVTDPDMSILWDTTPVTDQYFDFGGTPNNGLVFTNTLSALGTATSMGHFVIDHFDLRVPVIDHIYSAGEYVFKYDVVSTVSGNAANIELNGATGQEGVWTQLATGANITLADATDDGVAEHVVIDVTIALDNGSTAPVSGSEVTKRCTIISFKGSSADYIVHDTFTDTGGTALTAHTATVSPGSPQAAWAHHSGAFQITTGRAVATSATDNRAVIDSGAANICVEAELKFGSAECGLVGRAQDSSNYWLLVLEDASTSDPVLKLYEVNSGTPTERDSYTFTGLGPANSLGDGYFRLMFDGNNIYGECYFNYLQAWAAGKLTYTSTSFNTATLHGIYSATTSTTWDLIRMTDAQIGILT